MIDPKNSARAALSDRDAANRADSARNDDAERQRQPEVHQPGDADQRRHEADRHQRQRVQHRLPAGPRGRRARRPAASGSPRAVVVAVHPGDRHEVRNLPEEHDREQRPAASVDRAVPGRPADERRQRAGHGADERRDRRAPLQRRVDGEVDDERRSGDAAPRAALADSVRRPMPAAARTMPNDARFVGRDAAVRQRPQPRPLHQRVGVALVHLVQHRRAAGDERGAGDGQRHRRQLRARSASQGSSRPRSSPRRGRSAAAW